MTNKVKVILSVTCFAFAVIFFLLGVMTIIFNLIPWYLIIYLFIASFVVLGVGIYFWKDSIHKKRNNKEK